MSKHEKFIMTPMTSLMEDAIQACSGVGDGIETYPLGEYIMQSLLLKMSGFQEQKLKCILWELATDDYEFRYGYFTKNKNKYGECSHYNDKNQVFMDLKEHIHVVGEVFSLDEKETILEEIKQSIVQYSGSNLFSWYQRQYKEFCAFIDKEELTNKFADRKEGKGETCLLLGSLVTEYKDGFYRQRNRIAHNATSYQENLPDLKDLYREARPENSDPKLPRNYFMHFMILLLIDYVFIEMYKKYKAEQE